YADPAWSPDGRWLAAFSSRDYWNDVILMNPINGEEQPLNYVCDECQIPGFPDNGGHYEGSPSWSPDGQSIAFDSDMGRGYWKPDKDWWGIYVMKLPDPGIDASVVEEHIYFVTIGTRPHWRPNH
ncbi:MAG TPA: hypothetical protein VHL11_01100, partial [Phototrophicaceae bacterium]|nr:hypothetical protein [Phototrophicaceae bacterium]